MTKYTGAELKKIRLKHGMTQAEFGALFGRSKQDYHRIESDKDELHKLWQLVIRIMQTDAGFKIVKRIQSREPF